MGLTPKPSSNKTIPFLIYVLLVGVLSSIQLQVVAEKSQKCEQVSLNSEFPKIIVAARPIIPDSENTSLIDDDAKNETEISVSGWKGKRDGDSEIAENVSNLQNETRTSYLEVPENGRSKDGPLGELELICSASYPVQWGFRLFQLWTPWSVSSNRILISNENDTSSPKNEISREIFQSILKYPNLRNITQLRNDYPTCHKSDNSCLQTSLSVGSDGAKPLLKYTVGSDLILKPPAEFGNNSNCSLRIAYDEDAQVFFCQTTNTSRQVTIFPRSCANPVECSKVFQAQDESCPFLPPTVAYKDCRPKSGCGKMTYADGYLPSVAICLTRGSKEELANSIAVPFFYSLKVDETGQPERYLNFLDADSSKMLEMSQFPSPLYAGQEFPVHCNASYYYFGSGLYFEILRQPTPSNLFSSADALKSFLAKEHVIRRKTTGKSGTPLELEWLRLLSAENYAIYTPGSYEIFCKAPVWNTTEWVTKKSSVTILESIPPKFLNGGNGTEILYYEPDRVILCLSTGVPKPTLTWTLNESPLPSGVNVEIGQNSTEIWTSIRFPNSAQGLYGNFTCLAKNYAGSLKKTFSIIPSDKDSSTLIIAIAIMGILALILVPSVVYLCCKVRTQKKQLHYLTQDEVNEFLLGKPDYIPFQCDMSMYAYYLPYDKTFEIPRNELEIDFNQVLGSGAYGVVIFGKYKNAEVAVKTIKPHAGIDVFKALLSELKIMTYIGKHDNIVNLVGACTTNIQKKEVYIALEFCENGSLLAFMRTHRHSYLNPGYVPDEENGGNDTQGNNKPPLTKQPSFLECPQVQYVKMEDLSHIAIINPHEYANMLRIGRLDLFRWAYQIADGMNYLATKKVIHGDLAARNVMLTRDLTAKIGDFGLSKRLLHYNSYTRTADTPLPIKWMAIETLQQFQFTAESDVWSYGVVLWEIFSLGEIPYPGFNVGEEFLQRLAQGMRLSQPIYCSEDVFSVMMKCWKHDRKQRPKFNVLSQYFRQCLEIPPHTTVGLRLSNLESNAESNSSTTPITPKN